MQALWLNPNWQQYSSKQVVKIQEGVKGGGDLWKIPSSLVIVLLTF